MAVTVICPNLLCRGILQVPDSVRGRKVRCGKCGKDLLIPEKTDKDSEWVGATEPHAQENQEEQSSNG